MYCLGIISLRNMKEKNKLWNNKILKKLKGI